MRMIMENTFCIEVVIVDILKYKIFALTHDIQAKADMTISRDIRPIVDSFICLIDI